jgi:hypothetical protein
LEEDAQYADQEFSVGETVAGFYEPGTPRNADTRVGKFAVSLPEMFAVLAA